MVGRADQFVTCTLVRMIFAHEVTAKLSNSKGAKTPHLATRVTQLLCAKWAASSHLFTPGRLISPAEAVISSGAVAG